MLATAAAAKPTRSETCPPYMSRPRMSKPLASVPSGCPLPGGALSGEKSAAEASVWFVWYRYGPM